jgi:hypothetical protein
VWIGERAVVVSSGGSDLILICPQTQCLGIVTGEREREREREGEREREREREMRVWDMMREFVRNEENTKKKRINKRSSRWKNKR